MLGFPKKRFRFIGKAQSGFYIDFFLKKVVEVFIRNVFIYAALFFGEKYIIEQVTKKTVDSFIFNSNKLIGWNLLISSWFFYIGLSIFLYLVFFINIFFL